MCDFHCSFSTKLSFGNVLLPLKGVSLAVAVLRRGIEEKEIAVSYCFIFLELFILFDVYFALLGSYSEDFEEETDTNPALKTEGDQVNQNVVSEVDLSPQEQVL